MTSDEAVEMAREWLDCLQGRITAPGHMPEAIRDLATAVLEQHAEIERLHGMVHELTSQRGFYENEIDARRLLPIQDWQAERDRLRAALKETLGLVEQGLRIDYGFDPEAKVPIRERIEALWKEFDL